MESSFMKKTLLAGLLAVSACFSIGSTSFAASIQTTKSTALPVAELTQIVTPFDSSDYFADIERTVGQSIYVTGYDFYYLRNLDGAVIAYQDDRFEAVAEGYAVIAADIGNDNRLIYRVTVK